jgi:histidine triad (HIT) family protein
MDDCIFCKIIKGEAPSYIVDENADVLVFLSLDNHPLVVPRQHVEALYDLDDATGAALMRETVRVTRALKEGLACDGVYLTQANGSAAGQDVFHLHIHLYPRWLSASRVPTWVAIADNELRQRTAERIRAKLATP